MLLKVDETAARVERIADHTFTDRLLAAEAVQMAAPDVAVIYGSFRPLPNNKRLSVLGNAVLTKVLCGLWYAARDRNGKQLDAADWNTLRTDLLSNDNLTQRGYALGVDKTVFCNQGTVVSAKMVASTLEAIVGAVYQDGGDNAILRLIEHLGFTQHCLLMVTLHISQSPNG